MKPLTTRPNLYSHVTAAIAFTALLHTADAAAAPRQKKVPERPFPIAKYSNPV